MGTLDSRTEQANRHHLVMDIAWFGFATAATGRFLPYFAIRAGATPLEVGLVTSLPAVILFLVSWLSGWWHRRYDNSLRAMLWPSVVHRLAFLLPAFAPIFPPEWRPLWIVLAATLPSVGAGVSSTIFVVMMREAVWKEHLTPLMARRKLWMSIAIGVGTLLAGLILEATHFPTNYQIVFLVATAGSLVSFSHLIRIKVESKLPLPAAPLLKAASQYISSSETRAVAFVTLAAYVSFHFIVGVIPLHLNGLGASEGFIAVFGLVELLSAALSTVAAVRLVRRLGNRTLVAASVVVTAVAAIILALASSIWVTLIGAAITGAAWTIADIAMFGYFAERTHTGNMSATIVYNEMMYLGIFVGPLLGNGMVELGISTAAVLIIGAGVRLLAGVLVRQGGKGGACTEPLSDRA